MRDEARRCGCTSYVESRKPESGSSGPTAQSAKLGQSEIEVGDFPLAAIADLPSWIAVGVTAEVVLLGYNFTATRGRELGLVNDVFPDAVGFAKVEATCAGFAEPSCPARELTKRAFSGSTRSFKRGS